MNAMVGNILVEVSVVQFVCLLRLKAMFWPL